MMSYSGQISEKLKHSGSNGRPETGIRDDQHLLMGERGVKLKGAIIDEFENVKM